MKKKAQTVQPPSIDLKSLIHDHSLFFDKLIELIPARFYLPNDDDKAKAWFQGLTKAEKASAKEESRENIKKARRDRLDPEKSSKSTLDLLKKSLENEKSDSESNGDEETETKPIKPVSGLDGDDRSVTYEELRHRLRRRIEEFRANRNYGKKSRNERGEIQERKRRRSGGSEEEKGRDGNGRVKSEKEVSEAAKGLAFGNVKIGGEEELGKTKKRKVSKAKELENAKKLVEAKKDPEKGVVVSKKHSWKAVTSRAAGIKVHDDPKLLKQSMHKEKKRHEKSVGKWKERVETIEKKRAEKQRTRSGNIAERIHQKKMRRIAKREKKLMRPGFQGRKEGYIN